ncbi:MAG: hypothetical protein FWC62_02160 [Firmicutes bacterium]|nr:hypothetical protein [Bacillota bacterium]
MAHVVTLTGNVPIAVYRKAYITREQVAHPNFKLGKDSNGHFKEHCNCRLQDGLVVVDNDEGLPDSVHLLVDDNRSLLKSIYRLKLAVLREYDIFAHED